MILSVIRHTSVPVKFWFIKNYLSPRFKDFLPHMARYLHFASALLPGLLCHVTTRGSDGSGIANDG